MNLPEGTHLAYVVSGEAWYASAARREIPDLMVMASAEGAGGGEEWEFQITEQELGGEMCTRVKMFNDSYAAFTQMPEFFAVLARTQPKTLADVRSVLAGFGAVDETKRVSPYADDADRCTCCGHLPDGCPCPVVHQCVPAGPDERFGRAVR